MGSLGNSDQGGDDSGVSLLDWHNNQPVNSTPPASQIIISTDVVSVDFAVGFGTQTRPADQRTNSRLLKLFADGLLIYTATEGFTGSLAGLTVTWHPGFADAMPDPTIQAAVGPNCPPFRDEMYVVIKGYPMPSNSAKLPVIRAEISDIDVDPDPVPTAYTVGATHIVDDGGFVDASAGLFFGYDSTTSAPHSIYAYDIASQTEQNHVTISPLTNVFLATGLPYWNVYDKDNGIVLFQNGAAIGNSMPVAAVRVTDGHVLDNFGVESVSLSSSDVGLSISYFAGLMKYRGFGVTCYGLMAGGIFDEVKYLGYTHAPMDLPTAANMPNVRIDRGGIVQGNDLTLKFDAALTMPSNVLSLLSYPVLDRPELAQSFDVNNALFQAHVGLVGYGSKIAVLTSGIAVKPGYSVTPIIEFKVFNNMVIADVGVGTVQEMFVDPLDGDVMVIVDFGGGVIKLNKYHPIWNKDNNGVTIASFQIVYQNIVLPGYNIGAMRNAIRQSVLTAGQFGYVGDSNHFIAIELATGATVYDHVLPTGIGDHWSFNGLAGTIESAHVVDGKVTHIDLFGPDTAGEVPLSTLLGWLAQAIGYAEDEISFDNLDDTVIGGQIERPQSARQLLATLAEVYDFDQVENGGTIKFVRTLRNAEASVAFMGESELSPTQEYITTSDPSLSGGGGGGGTSFAQGSTPDVNNLTATVAAPDEVPADVSISYIDPDAGYIDNTQIFRRVRFPFETVKTQRTDNYMLPIVMSATDALTRAGRLVFATFANSITFDWRVPHKFLDLEPSDVVTVLDRDNKANLIKITQSTLNADWSFTLSGINWSFNDNIALNADTPLGKRDPTFHGPSDSLMFAFDIPLIYSTDEMPNVVQVYTAVGNLNAVSFWEAARISRQLAGATSVNLFTTTFASNYGFCGAALPQCGAAGTTFQTDNTTVLTVTGRSFNANGLDSSSVTVDGFTVDGFLEGFNRALVGRDGRWELIFFRDAVAVDDHTATITGITRGRRGTEAACDLHEVGDYFIPVPGTRWQRDLLAATEIGKLDTYYAAGFNSTSTPRSDTLAPLTGASAKPWAPVRLKAIYGSEIDPFGSPNYFNSCGGGDIFTLTPSRVNKITVTGSFVPPDGTFSNLVDGDDAANSTGSMDMPVVGITNAIMVFDFRPFGFRQNITAFTWLQNNSTVQGNFDFEGSDDGVTWTPIDTNFPLVSGNPTETTVTNAAFYWFYRLKQVSGTTSNSPWCKEIFFKTVSDVSGNDLLITWLRRDRLGAEWVTNPQVLSEASETYEIEILNGDAVVRTVTGLLTPQYVYHTADQTTDGFSPPLANLGVRVYQMSALVGRGFPGEALIGVT